MSLRPYNLAKIRQPGSRAGAAWLLVDTVEGPGIHHPQVIQLLGDNPSIQDLTMLRDTLNIVFVIGRRSCQNELRLALGIRSWGEDLTLDKES
jgi:hypothetical protein